MTKPTIKNLQEENARLADNVIELTNKVQILKARKEMTNAAYEEQKQLVVSLQAKLEQAHNTLSNLSYAMSVWAGK